VRFAVGRFVPEEFNLMMPTLFDVPILGWPIRGYGFMLMLGFLSAIWMAAKRAQRVKADPDIILNVGFIALLGGVVGARLFYVVHYWESSFARQPNPFLAALDITSGGLEFYGGFLFVLVLTLGYLKFKGVSVRMYTDIMIPSLVFGLAFGRMGCFLNGCCWGAVCADEEGHKAIPWAMTFPYGGPAFANQWFKRQLTVPADLLYVGPMGVAHPISRDALNMSDEDLRGPGNTYERAKKALDKAERDGRPSAEIAKLQKGADGAQKEFLTHQARFADLQKATGVFGSDYGSGRKPTVSQLRDYATANRTLPVQPAQLYGVINALLISAVLSTLFRRRKRHGVLTPIMFIMYSLSRSGLELVRVDNPTDQGFMTISQLISIFTVVVAVIWLLIVYRMPMRSPLAIPYVYESDSTPADGKPAPA